MSTQPTLFDTPTATIPATPNGTPNWLVDHLIASGHLTETGLTRQAKLRTCRTCKALVLAGLDDDQCALEVRCDPQPLTPLGEALALLEGRRTLAMHKDSRGYLLDRRWSEDIQADPAGTRAREDILREHQCSTGPPTTAMVGPTRFGEATPRIPPGSPAPF